MKGLVFIVVITLLPQKTNAQWTILKGYLINYGYSCVFFPSRDTGFIVGEGNIFCTNDGGLNWFSQHNPNYVIPLNSVFFVSDSIGWCAGGGVTSLILKTTDCGKHWNVQSKDVHNVPAIYFINKNTGWAIGNDGTKGLSYIYKTTDGGDTWTMQQQLNDYVRSIFFNSESIGWVAGDNGAIYTTTNGGVNWIAQKTKVIFHFKSIFSVSKKIAWAVGGYKYGGCYKTTNGGKTWKEQDLPSLAHLKSIYFTSAKNGWIVGERGVILKTIDGGKNWIQQISNTKEDLNSIYFPNKNIGYIVGNNGTILKHEE